MSAILEKIFANKDRINKGKEIIGLSVIAAIGIFLSSLQNFISYDYSGVSLYFPDEFNFLSYLLILAPSFVFAFFMIRYHILEQNQNAFLKKSLLPICLGLIAIPYVFDYIGIFIDVFIHRYYSFFDIFGSLWMILELVLTVAYLLAAYTAIRGAMNKKVLIAGAAAGILGSILDLERIKWLVAYEYYLLVFLIILGFVGRVALHAAMLLYGLNNDTSVAVSDTAGEYDEADEGDCSAKSKLFRAKSEEISAEEALYRLNHQFDGSFQKKDE